MDTSMRGTEHSPGQGIAQRRRHSIVRWRAHAVGAGQIEKVVEQAVGMNGFCRVW